MMRRIPVVVVVSVILSSTTLTAQPGLIPKPRELATLGTTALPSGLTIDAPTNADDRFVATDLADALRERGINARIGTGTASARITLLRANNPAAQKLLTGQNLTLTGPARDEGYAILSDGNHLTVIAATNTGVFYGAQTVKQLIEGNGPTAKLNRVRIRDWPAMPYRGLHDDLSRGPVPTLDFQKKQIRTLAAYKINVYSPYFEQTLTYAKNPLAAPPGGAMSADDIRALVAYARQYHIDVIPEQEAFGHLHHLLKYEIYSPLAETPHGHVLAPGQPGSMELIKQMFAEIDSLFPSRFIHLGADETFELGRGQTMDSVKAKGLGAVYLGFLQEIEQALRPTGKRFLFWGDIAQSSPDLVKTLPKDMIAVAWEYDPAPKFDRLITPFTDAGLETWVAPGVNNWNRVWPNFANALANIQGFIRDGQRLGATGALNTTWDDDGEALFNQTWYAVLFGAAASWQPGESSIDDFQRSFGRTFHGDTTGLIDAAQRQLIAAHAVLQRQGVGDANDFLFWLDPYTDEGMLTADRIRPALHDVRLLAESALVNVANARRAQPKLRETDALDAMELGARRVDFIGMKFQFAEEISAMYARAAAADTSREGRTNAGRELSDITGINGRAQDLRDGYTLTRELYEKAWARENKPYWEGNVLARFDKSAQLWIERMDRVTRARREWSRTRKLPPPDSVGIRAPKTAPTVSSRR